MEAGKLRNFITIQKVSETFDDKGNIVQTWQDMVNLWAEILPLVGREYWSSKQVNAETTGKLRTRYYPGITPKMRIKFGNRYFEILGVINIEEKGEEMVIYYKEAL